MATALADRLDMLTETAQAVAPKSLMGRAGQTLSEKSLCERWGVNSLLQKAQW